MILFWTIAAVMLLVAVLFLVVPLWRKSSSANDIARDEANLGILRDQSVELETDLRNGLLTQEAYEQGKSELQARLLDEVKSAEQPAKTPHNPIKLLAIVLAIAFPLATIPVYLQIGYTRAMLPQEIQAAATGDGIARTEEALQALVNDLKDKHDNPNGWYNLARSYIEMKRYDEGAKAYEELVKLVPDDAQLWANYADVYAMAHGKTLQSPEVANMLQQALAYDPNNITALALSGSVGMERGDYVVALTHWQKLYSLLQPDSADAQQFKVSIQRARDLLAAQPGGKKKLAQLPAVESPAQADAGNPAASISGKVSLSPALAAKASPEDTVFVLARATQGPKMPLAVFRKQVKDLPMNFTLDDSMAMRPEMKLSGFDQVVVVARVSKSGTPMSQPGDFEGLSADVKPGAKGLKLVIDKVVP
ncbi:MAG: c-type cytochrome biogenesis protein CcmI [Gallionella sp.]